MTVVAVRPVSVPRNYRFELVKLVSQWRIRLLVLACWIAPAVFVAAVSRQSTLPVDTLFGGGCTRPDGPDRWWCSASRAAGRSRC
jgi:hypothetical protein